MPEDPVGPPSISVDRDYLRRLALQLRSEHDGRTQASVLASIDPNPRCSVCHYTRHPCAIFELTDAVLTMIDEGAPDEYFT